MVRHANFHAPSLRCTIESFGIDRILLGSDFPYFQNDLYTRTVRYIGEAGLTAGELTQIFETNPTGPFRLSTTP